MTGKTLHVVGNRFSELSNSDTVLSFDEAVERCRAGRIDAARVSLQQGVSESQHQSLKALLDHHNPQPPVRLTSYFDEYRRCSGTLTHKAKVANTLISEPEPMTEADAYASILMIDDDCAELSDHVTGKHIQFMVLIEAARQMANAVTQKFYSTSAKMYLAEEIGVAFKAFAYPFETRLECRLTSKNVRATGDGKMALAIGFIQQGKPICQLSLAFTILDRKFVASMEANGLKAFVN